MNCEDYKLLLQEYHDGELEKGKESFVFIHLSSCQECREFYKSLNLLGLSAKEEMEEFPFKLDERIYYSIADKKQKGLVGLLKRRTPAYISYLIGVVLLVISILFLNSSNQYRDDLKETMDIIKEQHKIVDEQNKQIQMILNSYLEVKVISELENKIIINAKM